MYYWNSGTRMLQDRSNIRSSTFTIYNTKLDKQIEISKFAAEIIRREYTGKPIKIAKNRKYTDEFWNDLIKLGFVYTNRPDFYDNSTIYFGKSLGHHFPLTALNIELTNACNLYCKHCYGSFSKTFVPKFVSFEWIRNNLNDLNDLHVRKIALTGGESTIHPDFLKIALFFMEQGFELCIFTNGYNNCIIKELLEKSERYHFTMKVSLDGIEEVHNLIRGNRQAYSNTFNTLKAISKYDNVTLYITTTVLRQNIDTISELDEMIKSNFPKAIHTKDLGFPLGNADSCAFTADEFSEVDEKIPNLFKQHMDENSQQKAKKFRYLRCTGGVSQCTIMPDGNLKICNAACDSRFYFKYNAYDKGLKYAWLNCGKMVGKFRKEKAKRTRQCKRCRDSKICKRSNCRVLAWVYTGNANNSSPVTCFAAHKRKENVNK